MLCLCQNIFKYGYYVHVSLSRTWECLFLVLRIEKTPDAEKKNGPQHCTLPFPADRFYACGTYHICLYWMVATTFYPCYSLDHWFVSWFRISDILLYKDLLFVVLIRRFNDWFIECLVVIPESSLKRFICDKPDIILISYRLRIALEIWDEDVAGDVVVVAGAAGVVSINRTTINTTRTTISTTKTVATTVTGVLPIQWEPHHLATQSRLSNHLATQSRLSSSRRQLSHSPSQRLTNSLQVPSCRMAHVDSPWAEGSRKHWRPEYPSLNLEQWIRTPQIGRWD